MKKQESKNPVDFQVIRGVALGIVLVASFWFLVWGIVWIAFVGCGLERAEPYVYTWGLRIAQLLSLACVCVSVFRVARAFGTYAKGRVEAELKGSSKSDADDEEDGEEDEGEDE